MTLRAVGFGPRFPRAWLFPITAMTVVLAVAAGGRLSRSIVADLIAWWPVWLGLVVVAYLFRAAKLGPVRVAGLVPAAALLLVLVFTWGHLAGWAIMPSAAQKLVGPAVGDVTEASMTAIVDGQMRLGGGSETLYEVGPIRRGGAVGIPTATELNADGATSIALRALDDPGVYVYAGWDILLSPSVPWNLTLDGAVEADLDDVTLSRLSLGGAGVVALGHPAGETPVAVPGRYEVTVPAGVFARVVGTASVPATWTLTADGAVSPGVGAGWVLTVVGDGALTVREK